MLVQNSNAFHREWYTVSEFVSFLACLSRTASNLWVCEWHVIVCDGCEGTVGLLVRRRRLPARRRRVRARRRIGPHAARAQLEIGIQQAL